MSALKLQVLVVDPDPEIRSRLLQQFDRSGFETYQADSAEEAFRILGQHQMDAAVIDLESVGRKALDLMRFARERTMPIEVILLTGPETVSLAIEAMKLGAFDDLLVPVDLEALTRCVRAAGDHRRKTTENMRSKSNGKGKREVQAVVGRRRGRIH